MPNSCDGIAKIQELPFSSAVAAYFSFQRLNAEIFSCSVRSTDYYGVRINTHGSSGWLRRTDFTEYGLRSTTPRIRKQIPMRLIWANQEFSQQWHPLQTQAAPRCPKCGQTWGWLKGLGHVFCGRRGKRKPTELLRSTSDCSTAIRSSAIMRKDGNQGEREKKGKKKKKKSPHVLECLICSATPLATAARSPCSNQPTNMRPREHDQRCILQKVVTKRSQGTGRPVACLRHHRLCAFPVNRRLFFLSPFLLDCQQLWGEGMYGVHTPSISGTCSLCPAVACSTARYSVLYYTAPTTEYSCYFAPPRPSAAVRQK